ncbi:MAG: hypothetical protein ACUVS3_10235 [Thermodesulfobacteriota bacterium]
MSKRVLTRGFFLVVMSILLALTLQSEGIGREQRVKNIILFIGDGMHLEHEIAASRYLYRIDTGLIFHRFPYQTDVTTYNGYAGGNVYDPARINPYLGYDPLKGGDRPHPYYRTGLDEFDYFFVPGGPQIRRRLPRPGPRVTRPIMETSPGSPAIQKMAL